jgi:hypothetical protein
MLIFTVRDFFFEVLLLFHIPYIYRVWRPVDAAAPGGKSANMRIEEIR